MQLTSEMRSILLDLALTLEELLTRPLREQEYQPDLSRVAAVAQLAIGQVRYALALDDATPETFDFAPPLWCPPEQFGQRLRARRFGREARQNTHRRRPRA